MDNLALILKNYGHTFIKEDQKLIFSNCPLCKSESHAACNERSFYCKNCINGSEAMSITDFFASLNITIDNSPTDIKELLEKNAEILVDPQFKGYETGYNRLDKRTGGLLPDHLYILASETGMGKSAFSMNLLLNISKNQHVSYFDLENGKMLMLKRFVSIDSLQPISIFEDPENITTVIEAGEKLSGRVTFRDNEMLQPYIGNLQGESMAKTIADLIRIDVKEKQTKVVVIDPLENFESDDKSYNVTGRVVELFKNLAQELRIVIIINHHLKKPEYSGGKRVSNLSEVTGVTYRIPTIYDLTGTSKITNKATDVWTIVRQKDDQDPNSRGKMMLRILKSREDRTTDTSDLYFYMNLSNGKIAEVDFSQNG